MGLLVITTACGTGLTVVHLDFSHAADGAFHGGLAVSTNLVDTELTIASKDVVVNVTHGVRGVNGATSTIIKKGKIVDVCALADVKRGANKRTSLNHDAALDLGEHHESYHKVSHNLCHDVGHSLA